MSGGIHISETRTWMLAGWAFRGIMKSALKHIPDSMTSLKSVVENSIKGLNWISLDTRCTTEEVRVFLNALREGYKETESAGPSSFGDPSYFLSYMEGFAELIHMIEEELDDKQVS